MACINEYDCGNRFCTSEKLCYEEQIPLKIGDKIKDRDGTDGTVIEITDAGNWIRYQCRPYAILANLLTGDKNTPHVRRFWNMRRNLILRDK